MMAADDDRPSSADEMVKTKAYANMQDSREGKSGGCHSRWSSEAPIVGSPVRSTEV